MLGQRARIGVPILQHVHCGVAIRDLAPRTRNESPVPVGPILHTDVTFVAIKFLTARLPSMAHAGIHDGQNPVGRPALSNPDLVGVVGIGLNVLLHQQGQCMVHTRRQRVGRWGTRARPSAP